MQAPVGLLLVHGIGNQRKGQTLDGFLAGMRLAYGDQLDIRRVSRAHAALSGVGSPVEVFEVFWADRLRGDIARGSFVMDDLYKLIWFPMLNRRARLLSDEECPRWRVMTWTIVLVPLSLFIYLGYRGAKFISKLLGIPFRLVRWMSMRGRHRQGKPPRRRPRRGALDILMDNVAGDVFSYVKGSRAVRIGKTLDEEPLAARVSEIHMRFLEAGERAVVRGCQEIQVLAHSLGTVVAFRAMCSRSTSESSVNVLPITRFFTIGSPLEKFRFFWTALVAERDAEPAIVSPSGVIARAGVQGLTWDNFHSRLDLVSGPLGSFGRWPAPRNHSAHALGGLLSSHVAYPVNPAFLTAIGERLTGVKPVIEIPWFRRASGVVRSGFETLILPALMVALFTLGLTLTIGVVALSALAILVILQQLGVPDEVMPYGAIVLAEIPVLVILLTPLLRRGRAKREYERDWAPPPSAT